MIYITQATGQRTHLIIGRRGFRSWCFLRPWGKRLAENDNSAMGLMAGGK